MLFAYAGGGRVWFSPPFVPCRDRLTFFVLPKKVSKERRARDGERFLEFMSQRGEGKNSRILICSKNSRIFTDNLLEKLEDIHIYSTKFYG